MTWLIGISVLWMTITVFSSFMIYYRTNSKSYTRGAGTGSFHFTPGFKWWSRYPVCRFLCSALSAIVCHRRFLFLLTMVLCVLSFIVSGYSINIFKLFLALKSTTEIIGSKVPKRVFSVFVCGCYFSYNFDECFLLYIPYQSLWM